MTPNSNRTMLEIKTFFENVPFVTYLLPVQSIVHILLLLSVHVLIIPFIVKISRGMSFKKSIFLKNKKQFLRGC